MGTSLPNFARGIVGKVQNNVDGMVMTNTQQHYNTKIYIYPLIVQP